MRALLLPTLLLLGASLCRAESGEEQMPVGPRPMAMGGAFVAVAEDVDALAWNPAGLGRLRVSTLRATQADLHGLGIRDNVIGFATPIRDGLGFALEWYHGGFDEGGLRDGLDRIQLGAGWQLLPRLSAGASVKYRRYEQSYEGVDEGAASGLGADLGVLFRPHPLVRVAAGWMDAGGSSLHYDDGVRVRPYDAQLSAGVAVRAHPSLLLAASLDRDAHAGIEWNLLGPLDLRAGWTKDLDGLDGARLAAGLGIRYRAIRFDYTYQGHPMLEATHRVGLAVDFTLAPRLVELRELHVDPLFASFYKSYAYEAPAELVLISLSDEPVELTVRVSQPELMRRPTELTQLLLPGVVQRIAIPLQLDARVAALTENAPHAFDVEVEYASSGRPRSETRQARPMVYRSGLLDWGSGVERAAAFVTPDDPGVDAFTRMILESTASDERTLLRNRTATLAARLFDGAAASGFRYQPDALNPYGTVQGRSFAVDDIQYPAAFLRRRSGDCDDSTVLYASMLANVGIRSALIDVPGHIYLMFDTRIAAREREFLGVDPGLLIPRDGTLWIPVETTQLGAEFASAWREGADLYRRYEGGADLDVVDLQEARRRYEPIALAADVATPDWQLDAEAARQRLAEDGRTLEGMRQERLRALSTDGGDERARRTTLARTHHRYGEWDAARVALEAIVERDASVWNNLGAVLLAKGDAEAALAHFDRAHELDPSDPGISLNRGIALHLAGDEAAAAAELRAAIEGAAGLSGALELLSLQLPQGDSGRAIDVLALEELALQSVENLMRRADDDDDLPASAPLAAAGADSTGLVEDDEPAIVALGEVSSSEEHERELVLREREISAQSYAEILYWKETSQP